MKASIQSVAPWLASLVCIATASARPQCPGWESGFSVPGNGMGPTGTSWTTVASMTVHDLGAGQRLFAGGSFQSAGGVTCSNVASFDGTSWSALSTDTDGAVIALSGFDDGSGRALYAGGLFTRIGGVQASHIGKWDGTAWQPVGGGLDGSAVSSLVVFDDGAGSALYAAGAFSGSLARCVVRWDGSTWSALGGSLPEQVDVLCVHDDGAGPRLYAAWNLTTTFPATCGVSKWTGSTWLTIGTTSDLGVSIRALCTFHDSSGPALCACGGFDRIGGVDVSNIAKWNGTTWSGIGPGIVGGHGWLSSVAEFDDGTGGGPALYVAEDGNVLWKWDGASWASAGQPLGFNFMPGNLDSLAVFDGGSANGPALFLGGSFQRMDDVQSNAIAALRGCGHPGVPICFGDGSGAACPCANSGSPGRGCQNSAGTGGAVLEASGWASLAHDSLVLTATGELPSALTVFLQGSAEIAPRNFGDGLRCAGGALKRLYSKSASGGTASAPGAGDLSVSARSAALGGAIAIGGTRVYQTYYRDPSAAFCASPPGNFFNASSGLRIGWLP